MTVTININNLTLCHKGSNGISMATIPDVCKTPSPGGPVPIPYPNIAMSSDLVKGTTTVKADGGNMCANKPSMFMKSTGDEPGTAGGVVSGVFAKEATWITYSFDVKLEGKNACRLTDKMFHNKQNTVNMGGELQPPLAPADAELIRCILEMCAKDKEVVEKASSRLTVYSRNPKKMILHRYQGGTWTSANRTSLGSARGTTIWLNRGQDCETTKETVYHEVVHTDQPADMPRPTKEIDAYTKTEQWLQSRGKMGAFGKIGADGKPTVDSDAIRNHVEGSYGYSIPKGGGAPPPQVVGKSTDGKLVTLEDGTSRAPQEGDAFLEKPPQDLQEERIPPEKLKCP